MAILRPVVSLLAVLAVSVVMTAAGAAAEEASVETSTDRAVIAIGDTVSLNLDLRWGSGTEIKPIAVREKLGSFVVRDIRDGLVEPDGEGFKRRVSILLTIFETGEHTVPSLPVLYTDAEGKVRRLETRPVEITVESVLAEDAQDIRDIKPPLSVGQRWREILLSYALLVGLAGAAATSVLVSVRKRSDIEDFARRLWERITRPVRALIMWLLALLAARKRRPAAAYDIEIAAPEIPPEDAAFQELARIEALRLIEQGLIKQLYTLVSEVLRRYIERKYGVLAMELPTSYIMGTLAGRRLMANCYAEVREVLEECDLVKFARHIPPDNSAASLTQRARDIVRATMNEVPGSARLMETGLCSPRGADPDGNRGGLNLEA